MEWDEWMVVFIRMDGGLCLTGCWNGLTFDGYFLFLFSVFCFYKGSWAKLGASSRGLCSTSASCVTGSPGFGFNGLGLGLRENGCFVSKIARIARDYLVMEVIKNGLWVLNFIY